MCFLLGSFAAGKRSLADRILPRASAAPERVGNSLSRGPRPRRKGANRERRALTGPRVTSVVRGAGVTPGGDGASYLQAFRVPTGVRLGAKVCRFYAAR
jgi:hypothetical protein